MSVKRVLVTGATGFIGSRIVEMLSVKSDIEVVAGIHNWSSGARIGRLGVNMVACDVTNLEQVEQAMNGIDTIIHCAVGNRKVIVEGTRNVLAVASTLDSLERVVHLSTSDVYGDVSGDIDELASFQYTSNPYADAKIDAEKICWEYIGKGVPVTIIRPPIVYGPFSKLWSIRYATRMSSRNWGIPKQYSSGICNLLYIDDLVCAIINTLNIKEAEGQAFNINGPDRIYWWQYFRVMRNSLSIPPPSDSQGKSVRVTAYILNPVRSLAKYLLREHRDKIVKISSRYSFAKRLLKRMEGVLTTAPTTAELYIYSKNAYFTTTKANRIFGYTPQYDLHRGLDMTAAWLAHHGYIEVDK